jgi:hypothetical protein
MAFGNGFTGKYVIAFPHSWCLELSSKGVVDEDFPPGKSR